jgi:hypothetical protein
VRTLAGSAPDVRPAADAGRTRALRWLRRAVGTAVAVAVLMFCYLRIAGTTPVVSDGAGNALQAWDMLHGNWLLSGWWATDVSFSTSALPLYAAVEAVAGLRPEIVHIAAAILYTLIVLLAAATARGRATGAEGWFRALVAVVILLAPEPGVGAYVLLGPPSHVSTIVALLLMLLLLDRAPRRWWVPVAAAVLLTLGIVGDPLILVVGALPLAAIFLTRAWLALHRSAATIRQLWYELALVAAAAAATIAAHLTEVLFHAAGGMQVNATPGQGTFGLVGVLPLAARNILSVFGADPGSIPAQLAGDPTGGTARPQDAVALACDVVHLAGVVLVAVALVLTLRGLVRSLGRRDRDNDPLSSLMAVAIVANALLFVTIFNVHDAYGGREVGPVLVLGAVLAGRELGPVLAGTGLTRAARGGLRPLVRPALAVLLAVNCLMLGIAAARPQAPPANLALTAWLRAHGLRDGLAGYWDATSVTLDSDGAVTVGAVIGSPIRSLAPYQWETDLRQFDPATHRATFLILSPYPVATRAVAIKAFGPAAGVYHFQDFVIMVWHKNLLRDLGPAAI